VFPDVFEVAEGFGNNRVPSGKDSDQGVYLSAQKNGEYSQNQH